MHSISVLWFVMVGLSSGQTTTISLFIPGADTQPLVGSIIASVRNLYRFNMNRSDQKTCRMLQLQPMHFNVLQELMPAIVGLKALSP
jgi:hypothetical protein